MASPKESGCGEASDKSKGHRERSAKQGRAGRVAQDNPDAALGADPCVEGPFLTPCNLRCPPALHSGPGRLCFPSQASQTLCGQPGAPGSCTLPAHRPLLGEEGLGSPWRLPCSQEKSHFRAGLPPCSERRGTCRRDPQTQSA